MAEILLDTGVWFGCFVKDDIFHHDVEIRSGDVGFRENALPANFSRLFLKTLDFIIASYALHWAVDEFCSFDENLNQALRRIRPRL